jgi:hypothetical protein
LAAHVRVREVLFGTYGAARCRSRREADYQWEGDKMLRVMLAAVAVAAGVVAFGGSARAEDKKEVKLTGTLVCGKCGLGVTKACSNALQVKDGEKTVTYFLDDKGNKEDYHEGVCGDGKIAGVVVTGNVTEKDGKKFVKPSKVELPKK